MTVCFSISFYPILYRPTIYKAILKQDNNFQTDFIENRYNALYVNKQKINKRTQKLEKKNIASYLSFPTKSLYALFLSRDVYI